MIVCGPMKSLVVVFIGLGLMLPIMNTVEAEVHPANLPAPPLDPSQISRPEGKPVLFIIGDSTVHNSSGEFKGWGDVVWQYFDTNRIEIQNHAKGGRSSRTYRTQGSWSNVLASARKGDFVIMQFGHNDAGPLDDTNRARGTLPGLGDETKEIYNPITRQKEVVHTYGWYIRQYIREAREAGMIPIVCSPVPRVPRRPVELSNIETNQYAFWAHSVAKEENACFVDLYNIVMHKWVGLTPEQIKQAYFTTNDNTHTTFAGADLNARAFVEGLRELKGCPLVKFLKEVTE